MFGKQTTAGGSTGTPSLFGTTAPTAGGFSFGGAPAAGTAAPSGGFSFGQTPTSKPAAAPGGFSFGSTPSQPAQPQATSSFSFGNNATAAPATKPAASGFQFGGTAPASAPSQQPATGFSLGGGAAGGFKFGETPKQPTAPPAPTATAGGSFSFGATPSGTSAAAPVASAAPNVAKPGFSLGGLSAPGIASTAATTQLSQTATSTPASGGLAGGLGGGIKLGGFGAPASTAQSTASAGLKLGTSTTSAPAGGLTLGTSTTSTPGLGGGLKLGGLGTKPLGTGLTLGTPASSAAASSSSGLGLLGAKPTTTTATGIGLGALGAKPTATTAASGPAETMSYRELEECINKWTVELEEQEKSFLHQAAQVNAWDRTLVVNGEKITSLHNDLEKVKADQQRLEHECDYIVAQQRELEDILVPLEEACKTQEGSLYRQHTDIERERTYQMSESIDSQLKRMVQDLKEIIDHMNTSNTSMDQTDPVNQVAKILNAHMNSLQWIDQNTGLVQRKVDEVTRQYEIIKRDQERNVHLAFE
ncbi:nuclear pore glycoprotein p62-like isoform X1 [Lytechinus variegatus]|uniref:nuclear pore glycoprotein p62-like isoform X1 n=1 Tax=Lytechinus variegatus TaxID=7654 RepID=UPI001BB18870|nr:nuclear pore glycoprotein p62-like isoform X1 [Lytechinus variegatus]XP_041466599.1 nuclear pore glycoprotein p62-like isoform X1 [Lytechinus variegatus]